MKNTSIIIPVLLAFCLSASCHKLAPAGEDSVSRFTFTASHSSEKPQQPSSVALKSHLSDLEDFYVLWDEGDNVSVFDADGVNHAFSASIIANEVSGQKDGHNAKLTEDEASGKFVSGNTYYSIFPYRDDNVVNLSKRTITTTLPTTQRPSAGTFTQHIAVSESVNEELKFYNVCGLVMFDITLTDIVSVVIRGNDDEYLTGRIKVVFDESIRRPEWSAVDGVKEVNVVTSDPAVPFAPGVYFATVLPQSFSNGITITMYRKDGTVASKSTTNPFVLERSKRIHPKNLDVGHTWNKLTTITNAAELQAFLLAAESYGASDEVKIINNIELKGYELVPATSFAGTLDGLTSAGEKSVLMTWDAKTPLIKTLNAGATVKNLAIGRYSTLTVGDGDAAFLVLDNKGTIDNCANSGRISSSGQSSSTALRYIGAIAAKSSGTMTNCANGGEFDLTGTAGMTVVGGVAGYVSAGVFESNAAYSDSPINYVISGATSVTLGGVAGKSDVKMSRCMNKGAHISVTGGTFSSGTISYIGGIVGYASAAIDGNLGLSDAESIANFSYCQGDVNINSPVAMYAGCVAGRASASISSYRLYYKGTTDATTGNVISGITVYAPGNGSRIGALCGFREVTAPQNDYNFSCKVNVRVLNASGNATNSNTQVFGGHCYGEVFLSGGNQLRLSGVVLNGAFVKGAKDTRGIVAGYINSSDGNSTNYLKVGKTRDTSIYGDGYMTLRNTNTVNYISADNPGVTVTTLKLFCDYAVGTGDERLFVVAKGDANYLDDSELDDVRVRVLDPPSSGSEEEAGA